ncbi:LuxR C-terminal-related transcriptional regulator [Streptomyces sp. NPDC055109]
MPWPFVARNDELKEFSATWANRRCQGVVVSGPAGVGKTRLAHEFLSRASQDGWLTGRATATAAAAAMPFGAIAHLIPSGVDLSDLANTFSGVADMLSGQKQQRWTFFVDDCHLLDAASARLLRELTEMKTVRFIGTIREGAQLSEAVKRLAVRETVQQIAISDFNLKDVECILQTALGGPIGRRSLYRLNELSNGNILYLRELVMSALTAGSLRFDGELWTFTDPRLPVITTKISQLVNERLPSPGSHSRIFLELLALCHPSSLRIEDAHPARSTILELEQAKLIKLSTEKLCTRVSLMHYLHAEVLRAEIPTLRRRVLLLSQAARIEARGEKRREDSLHIATLRLAAAGTVDPLLLIQAAWVAHSARDYAKVAKMLQALSGEHFSVELHTLLGEAYFETGEFDAAEDQFARADLLVTDEKERLLVALERTQNLFWGAARAKDALTINGAALADVTDEKIKDLLSVNEACMRVWSGDPNRALEILRDIHEIPDVRVRLLGMALKSAALQSIGRAGEGVRLSQEAHRQNEKVSTGLFRQSAAFYMIYAAFSFCTTGDLQNAKAAADQAFSSALRENSPLLAFWSAFSLAQNSWLAGHAAEARRWFAEALNQGRASNLPIGMTLATSGLAASCALLGDVEAAEAAHRTMEGYPRSAGFWEGCERLGEAWLLAARGHLAEARLVLTQAATSARSRGHLSSEGLLLCDIARLGGAKDVTRRLIDLAQVSEGRFALARARMSHSLTSGNPTELMEVADLLESIGADLLAAEAAASAAAAWRRDGHSNRAFSADQRSQACRARCPGVQTPLLATTEAVACLTVREREIALLAATGISSKEIAITLNVSARTVDNHLQHVFAKLNISTRRQLASVMNIARKK